MWCPRQTYNISGMVSKLRDIMLWIQADENGMSCYLERSKFTPNVAIYGRLGFRLIKEMTLDDHEDTCSV